MTGVTRIFFFFVNFPNANNPDSSEIGSKQPAGTEYGVHIYSACIGVMRGFESAQYYKFQTTKIRSTKLCSNKSCYVILIHWRYELILHVT